MLWLIHYWTKDVVVFDSELSRCIMMHFVCTLASDDDFSSQWYGELLRNNLERATKTCDENWRRIPSSHRGFLGMTGDQGNWKKSFELKEIWILTPYKMMPWIRNYGQKLALERDEEQGVQDEVTSTSQLLLNQWQVIRWHLSLATRFWFFI